MRSKKRSAASEPPPNVTLLLDENLQGPKIYNPLLEAGVQVARLQDHFPRGISDEELLRGLAGRAGWLLVTKDERMRYRPGVLAHLCGSGVGILVVTAGKAMTGDQLATVLKKAWKKLPSFLAATKLPFVAGITADGSVKPFKMRFR